MSLRDQIFFSDAAKELTQLAQNRKVVVITDKNVSFLYRDKLFKKYDTIYVAGGERCKNLRTADDIYSKLMDMKADRDTVIIGLGGGVVCDIAGFIAATYKRGCSLVLIPTTLLAQVDAAIGGKNGLNQNGFKNIIGTFRQPDSIIIDTGFLKTLDRNNLNNGVAEILKTSAVYDRKFFEKIEHTVISELNDKKMLSVIKKTVRMKLAVVKDDPEEKNLRKILNFGHTVGHALELKLYWLHHGAAVSVGMAAACKISSKLSGLSRSESERFIECIKLNGLPVKISKLVSTPAIIDAIVQDKKKSGVSIDIILLKNIGHPVINRIEISRLRELIDDIR